MATSIATSTDVVASLDAGPDLHPAAAHFDAVMDSADNLWIARSISASQTEVSYSPQIYASNSKAVVVTRLGGAIPVWLRCPEGTIYLFCGGASYELIGITRNLARDAVLTGLAALPRFWTSAWRGDELFIATDLVAGGISLLSTRDRGRSFRGIAQPTASTGALHPRVVIAPSGEMAVLWWENGSLAGAFTYDYATWTPIDPFQVCTEQWCGAIFIDQKLAVSFCETEGTIQRIECDSIGGNVWG